MNKYIESIKKVELFAGISDENILSLLTCLRAEIKSYEKGDFIIFVGDKVDFIGVMLEGDANILKENYEGERTIISNLTKCDYFAEAICCAGIAESPVSVVAKSNVKIMVLKFERVLKSCPNSCAFHNQVIENMLRLIAKKNIKLQNRMEIISKKSTRTKILSYLQSLKPNQNGELSLPFNREEFAEFLCVDRTALSHELSRMKKDGIIDYFKNKFKLL